MSARELLRQSDYELYVFSLFLPVRLRPGAWAVLALVVELASIQAKAQEPLARAMRLAWWREQLEALYAGALPRNHDILLELAPYIARGDLPRMEWDRLLEAYGRQMEGDAAAGGDTVAPWLHLLAALGGAYTEDYELREALGRGVATGMLRQSENLKNDTKNNLNATLCMLTYILYDLRADASGMARNKGSAIKRPDRAGIFSLRFWWRVLLTEW